MTHRTLHHLDTAAIAAMCVAAGLCGPAAADTIWVNGACGDDSWSGATPGCAAPDGSKLTIQSAIDAAGNGDEILVAPGTYDEAIDFSGKTITVRSTDGAAATIIDASALAVSAVTIASFENLGTRLEGFTVTGGTGSGGSGGDAGGGLYCQNSSPTVNDCVIVANDAAAGGGIAAVNSIVVLNDCEVGPDNSAVNGGGVYALDSTLNATGTAFDDNEASFGGGLHVFDSSLSLMGCSISGNMAQQQGGGLYKEGSGFGYVQDCELRFNSAVVLGGAMLNLDTSLWMWRTLCGPNTAGLHGGGMYNTNSGVLAVSCRFHGNQATGGDGGAVSNNASNVTLVDSVFSGNSASCGSCDGGAVFAATSFGTPRYTKVYNCTFWSNTAGASGGAVYHIGTDFPSSVTSSILWDNVPNEIAGHTNDVLVSYSDVEGGFAGTGNIMANPMFVDPAGADSIPGTADDDLRLQPGSPCVDAGDNAAMPADFVDLDDDGNDTEATPLDLDDNPRFVDDLATIDSGNGAAPILDMGAYELQESGLCPWDLDGDGSVSSIDLLSLLALWGTDPGGPPDFDGDGDVGTSDLLILLSQWGSCP